LINFLEKINIAIIGGGAAGFFGAINISDFIAKNAIINIFEKNREPLGKVKISGGGRCNVTHNCFDVDKLILNYPRGARELKYAFKKFQPRDTIKWFEDKGVEIVAEDDGRMFPKSNSSNTIIQLFLEEATKKNISIHYNSDIKAIEIDQIKSTNKFKLIFEDGTYFECSVLLICSGSGKKIWKFLGSLGHEIKDPIPSLFTFQVPSSPYLDLSGISVKDVIVSLDKKKYQKGSVLITHWGFSGPVILKLSAFEAKYIAEKNYNLEFNINWMGEFSMESMYDLFSEYKKQNPTKTIHSNPISKLPNRLYDRFLQLTNINSNKNWAEISNLEIKELSQILVKTQMRIEGKTLNKEEFVTCGGIKRQEINFETMESKKISGLFFAGEVIDIDGVTGGFNFQSAWTTSFIASLGIKQYIEKINK
jgi:predicted Rossmann fold flavoprotein